MQALSHVQLDPEPSRQSFALKLWLPRSCSSCMISFQSLSNFLASLASECPSVYTGSTPRSWQRASWKSHCLRACPCVGPAFACTSGASRHAQAPRMSSVMERLGQQSPRIGEGQGQRTPRDRCVSQSFPKLCAWFACSHPSRVPRQHCTRTTAMCIRATAPQNRSP